MAAEENSSLATGPSLLNRLKLGDDTQGWQDFYRLYGPLIRNFARKAGLTEDEAEEVVQETAVSVARNLPGYTYDPKVCAFKTWLLNLTQWRVTDQLRKRRSSERIAGEPQARSGEPAVLPADETARTATVERVPDPELPEFGAESEDVARTGALRVGVVGSSAQGGSTVRGIFTPALSPLRPLRGVREIAFPCARLSAPLRSSNSSSSSR